MQINLIVAVSSNGVIGSRTTNDLVWDKEAYKEDLQFFRKMTSGENSVVIMGSRTMDSIGRALPKRRNIVISRTPDRYKKEETGIETYSSIDEAIESCKEIDKVWLIGGASIYNDGVSIAKNLYITVIPEFIYSPDPNELVRFPFLNYDDYEMVEKIPVCQEKQIFCYRYVRDTWLEEPLTEKDL